MIAIPKELTGMVEYDENDNRILKDGATEEQKRIFQEFFNLLESEKLTDTIIEYEE